MWMSPKLRTGLGVMGGLLVTILAAGVFYQSVKEGEPNWKLLIMACGMSFLLFFIAFSSRKR